ncbi:bifunctional histidinol-phosphatase/imidazoleglycerol-phosphate dehydratase HisB [Halomonas denitrificans]|nr:bifunctional histidinol-phosphatase/imidazoleglycerol-phosphate dehydratase HisB [Halomonas denitrificans]
MSTRKILFIDRDGCLIEEPADEQIDSYEKFRLMTGVIPALLKLKADGYRFVMVSNQDGLGTDAFPEADFRGPHELLLQILSSQGIDFDAIHIDRSFPDDFAPTRKPGVGMLLDYLRDPDLDRRRSAVIGDRETDLQLAENMGIAGFRVGPGGKSWAEIATALIDAPRVATSERRTNETAIRVAVDLDATGPVENRTGIGFFDHMLDQLAAHGGFSLKLACDGDLHIDEHHTVEDCALALGQALDEALGDRHGIGRYGFTLPMDESLASAAIDLSGRPAFVLDGAFPRESVGGLHTEMVQHFFQSLAQALRCAIHLKITGENTHHMVEGCFKAVGRALRPALARGQGGMPSTKGML